MIPGTRRPRVVMTLLVRNEADIVDRMLSWNLSRGIDHVVAMDNASTDGTSEILQRYEATGRLTHLHQPSDAYLQGVWMTQMLDIARDRHGADWVVPVDADEFLFTPQDLLGPPHRGDLRDLLADVTEACAVRCPRRNLFGRLQDDDAPWADGLVYRATPELARPADLLGAPAPLPDPVAYFGMPPKLILRAAVTQRVHRGAHTADFTTDGPIVDGDALIYHAPVRNRREFEDSIKRIASAVDKDASASPTTSDKYRRWSRMLSDGADMDSILTEVLPDRRRLQKDLKDGRVTRDTLLRDQLATFVAPDRTLATVLLVIGAAGAQVAARLRAVGLRVPDDDTAGATADRLDALMNALHAEGDDVATPGALGLQRDMFNTLAQTANGLHGLVLDHPDLMQTMPHWREMARRHDIAATAIICVDACHDGESAAARLVRLAEMERVTRSGPRLFVNAHRLCGMEDDALRSLLVPFGLTLSRYWARPDPVGLPVAETATPDVVLGLLENAYDAQTIAALQQAVEAASANNPADNDEPRD